MQHEITTIDPDGLRQERWRFTLHQLHGSLHVQLASYHEQVRPTKRHRKWQNVSYWIPEHLRNEWDGGQRLQVCPAVPAGLRADVKAWVQRNTHYEFDVQPPRSGTIDGTPSLTEATRP